MTNVITREGAGLLRIGMPFEAIKAELGQPDSVEDGFHNWLIAGVQASVTAGLIDSLCFKGDKTADNEGFTSFSGKTDRGIGIGSSEKEVRAAYGTPESEYNGVFLALTYGEFNFVFHSGQVASIDCISENELSLPDLTLDAAEERDLEWFDENYENPNGREFDVVIHVEGNLSVSSEELRDAFGDETALVVDGNLTVDGPLNVDDGDAILVGGNIICQSLWIAVGQLQCKKLTIHHYLQFTCDDDETMETFDVSSIEVPLLLAPAIDPSDIASEVSCDFSEEVEVEEEEKSFGMLLASHFPVVVAALKEGSTIDDEWVLIHKKLLE